MQQESLNTGKTNYNSRRGLGWLLIIPIIFLIDIFYDPSYSKFWFWAILITMTFVVIVILNRLFNPKFLKVERKSREMDFKARYNSLGVFKYKENGFDFLDGDITVHILWSNIEAIFAFKRDLMTFDQLNIEVFLRNDSRIRLTEETDGWYQFIIKLKEIFPTIDKEFDAKLILPPFETNLTLVYNSTNKTQSELIQTYYEKYGR